MFRILCIGLALAGGLTSVRAAAANDASTPLTLEDAIRLAQEHAPQVDAQQAAVDAKASLTRSAGRLSDPQLVFGVNNLPVTGADAGSFTRDFMTMRKVGLMQSFPRGEKRRLEHTRAEAEADVERAELTATRLDIAREVSQAWIRRATTLTSLDRLRTLESEVELGAASARAALAAGRASSAEALSAAAAVAQLKTRVLKMNGVALQAQSQLERWIGAEQAARAPAALPAFDQLPVPRETLLASTHLHASILPFDARLAEARTDVELARAARRPDWSAEVSFAKRGPDFSDMASLQFTIDLPVFAGTRQNPVIAARSAEVKRIEAEREGELRMHGAELREALIQWEQAGEQLEQYERELVPLARERSRVTLASYRAGQADLRLALDAFQDEVNVLIDRADLQNERGQAWAFLRYLEPHHLQP
ncbi:MAG: TolC family protein [Gammaproteobacteria bacterium]